MSVYGVSEDEIKTLNREYKKIRDGYQIKVRNTERSNGAYCRKSGAV